MCVSKILGTIGRANPEQVNRLWLCSKVQRGLQRSLLFFLLVCDTFRTSGRFPSLWSSHCSGERLRRLHAPPDQSHSWILSLSLWDHSLVEFVVLTRTHVHYQRLNIHDFFSFRDLARRARKSSPRGLAEEWVRIFDRLVRQYGLADESVSWFPPASRTTRSASKSWN